MHFAAEQLEQVRDGGAAGAAAGVVRHAETAGADRLHVDERQPEDRLQMPGDGLAVEVRLPQVVPLGVRHAALDERAHLRALRRREEEP